MVDLTPERPSGIFEFVRLMNDLTEIVGQRVDLVERAALKHFVKEQVMSEKVDAF
jgi:predicted nucleotidyltransferase